MEKKFNGVQWLSIIVFLIGTVGVTFGLIREDIWLFCYGLGLWIIDLYIKAGTKQ